MKERILITGSSGMLGVDLSRELRRSYEVIDVDVIASPAKGGTKQSYKCDITKKHQILDVVKKAKPDIVIHTAAMTDVDGCELNPRQAYKINSKGTKNIALTCKEIDVALIYISTDFVFDGKKKSPYKESDKPHPISVYADSKLIGELVVKKVLKKYFILRTSWLYGKHGKNFVDTILKIAKKEKFLRVVDDQIGSPTYTKDLAKAIGALVSVITSFAKPASSLRGGRSPTKQSQKISYGTYHVSNAGAVSWFDYAKEILRLAGSRSKVTPVSSRELNRPAKRPAMSVLDNSKFIKFTGYRMRNWKEALNDYIVIARAKPEAI